MMARRSAARTARIVRQHAAHQLLVAVAADETELDLPRLEVDARDLHGDRIGQAEALPGALAAQLVHRLVELEVVGAELGDVHEPLDEESVERHEDVVG